VRELKAEFGTQVTFIVADIKSDQATELGRRFNLRSIPHFVVVTANGRERHEVGAMSKEELRRFIAAGINPR